MNNISKSIVFLAIGIAITLSIGTIGVHQYAAAAGASALTPGSLHQRVPPNPNSPGASALTPGSLVKEAPPNPNSPGASALTPGSIKSKRTPPNPNSPGHLL